MLAFLDILFKRFMPKVYKDKNKINVNITIMKFGFDINRIDISIIKYN